MNINPIAVKIHCRMACIDKEEGLGRAGYKTRHWCKHCSCAMPLELKRCYCCNHKLRTKSHYYKSRINKKK